MKREHVYVGLRIFVTVILVALTIGVFFAGRDTGSEISTTEASPGFWADSILGVLVMLVIDLAWLILLVLWIGKRHVGIKEDEPIIHPPNEHPTEDPTQE